VGRRVSRQFPSCKYALALTFHPRSAPRFKTSLQIIHLPPVSIYATLDAALVADYVVLLLSSEHEVEEEGERVLRCLQGAVGAQVVAVVQVSAECGESEAQGVWEIAGCLLDKRQMRDSDSRGEFHCPGRRIMRGEFGSGSSKENAMSDHETPIPPRKGFPDAFSQRPLPLQKLTPLSSHRPTHR
jgi:hypothetical protein